MLASRFNFRVTELINMGITSFRDLAEKAKAMKKKTAIAVVEAHDEHAIESVITAANDGIVIPMLIGDAEKIKEILRKNGANVSDFEIIASGGAEDSLRLAAELINGGRAAAIMKGRIESGEFMHGILKKEYGLVSGNRLSLTGFFETPAYHKLLAVTDMAVNIYPDLECKRAILENAVKVLNALGIINPKAALLASIEKVNPKMQDTVDADALKKMNMSGEIKNCVVEGPISFDLATSSESAKIKNYESPVAGDADLVVAPDITSGNVLAKSLTVMAGARTGALVTGANIPIMLTSRSAEASDKYNSITLAACVAADSWRK